MWLIGAVYTSDAHCPSRQRHRRTQDRISADVQDLPAPSRICHIYKAVRPPVFWNHNWYRTFPDSRFHSHMSSLHPKASVCRIPCRIFLCCLCVRIGSSSPAWALPYSGFLSAPSRFRPGSDSPDSAPLPWQTGKMHPFRRPHLPYSCRQMPS